MKKFTQKWAIVSLLSEEPEYKIFPYTDFPLHITLAGVFEIDHGGDWLSSQLEQLLLQHKSFMVKGDKEEMLGPNKEVRVRTIKPNSKLTELHNHIYKWLTANGAVFNDPDYQAEGYLPHSTFQKAASLESGQLVGVKSLSVIDLFPGGDGYKRKIYKTIKLKP